MVMLSCIVLVNQVNEQKSSKKHFQYVIKKGSYHDPENALPPQFE